MQNEDNHKNATLDVQQHTASLKWRWAEYTSGEKEKLSPNKMKGWL